MFEIVYNEDGRRLDGYTKSSPCEPNGSGELKMMSVMAVDGVMSFRRLKDVTNTCKHLQNSQTFGGISVMQWQKVGRR